MTIISVYMRKLLKAFKGVKGFTLIELLVVIGILGILAAALIATIDPFEQLKKGRDTTTRNTALEYLNALTRYYATNAKFPWDNAVTGCTTPPTSATLLANLGGCTDALEDSGELKDGFKDAVSASGVDDIILIRVAAANSSDINICFAPTSKSIRLEASTKYSSACNSATVQTGCPSATATNCYQLFK